MKISLLINMKMPTIVVGSSSLPAISLSRHVTVCTALVCGGQCPMLVSLEGEKAPLVWICGTLQQCSQDSLDKPVDGKCGPGRPKMTWKQLS